MTTELLLPITVPTNRTRLEVWKERHVIYTYCLDGFWAAADYPALLDWPSPAMLIFCGQGETEESACFALAEKLRLPWLESIAQKDLML